MPKRTNEFQQLIHSIHWQLAERATVQESQMVKDRVTGIEREVDILIEINEPGVRALIGVECKAEKRPLSIEVVEQIHAKYQNLVDKVMVVSKSGFRPNALVAAEKYGIEALTLDEAEAADWTQVVGKLNTVYLAMPRQKLIDVQVHLADPRGAQVQSGTSSETRFCNPSGNQQGTLDQIAESAMAQPEVARKVLEMYPDPGEYIFAMQFTPPPGTYITDKAGCDHEVVRLTFRWAIQVAERIPVPLNHKTYRRAQVAYGTFALLDVDGMLTVVESPGKPLSADVRLTPKKPPQQRKRTGKPSTP